MPLLIFSSRLEQLMKPENISKRKLSIETHVDRASITTYLQGSCLPRYEALARIADYFEVSADYLLGLEEENIYCYHTVCEIEEIPDLFICRLKELMREKGFSARKVSRKNKNATGIHIEMDKKTSNARNVCTYGFSDKGV